MLDEPLIRPLTEDDIPRLAEIRPGFVSDTALRVERLGNGLEAGWRLVEHPLPEPFDKGHAYDFDANERAAIRRRLQRGDGLHLVVEWRGRFAGLLEATPQEWNSTASVWNLMLDRAIRRQGVGRELFARAAAWARQAGYRALVFETQTNNVPACRFYLALGCRLDGLRETLYHNDDLARGEVALFWTYPLVR
jgi:ribosomal protein S18 acetylase RimI-like enzyme